MKHIRVRVHLARLASWVDPPVDISPELFGPMTQVDRFCLDHPPRVMVALLWVECGTTVLRQIRERRKGYIPYFLIVNNMGEVKMNGQRCVCLLCGRGEEERHAGLWCAHDAPLRVQQARWKLVS